MYDAVLNSANKNRKTKLQFLLHDCMNIALVLFARLYGYCFRFYCMISWISLQFYCTFLWILLSVFITLLHRYCCSFYYIIVWTLFQFLLHVCIDIALVFYCIFVCMFDSSFCVVLSVFGTVCFLQFYCDDITEFYNLCLI